MFVPYELAKLAKEKGFNQPSPGWWFADGSSPEPHQEWRLKQNIYQTLAPFYQQLVDWFREEKKICLTMNWSGRSCDGFDYWHCQIHTAGSGLQAHINKTHYNRYEKDENDYPLEGMMTPHFENLTYYDCLTKALEEAFKLLP